MSIFVVHKKNYKFQSNKLHDTIWHYIFSIIIKNHKLQKIYLDILDIQENFNTLKQTEIKLLSLKIYCL